MIKKIDSDKVDNIKVLLIYINNKLFQIKIIIFKTEINI
jgi:hypothetical protein